MVNSIRVRLLLWNALVMTGVVVGFAVLLYHEVEAGRIKDLDAELEAGAAGLESACRLCPPDMLRPESHERRPRGKGEYPPALDSAGREFHLARVSLPGPPDAGAKGKYFAIYRADGKLIKGAGLPDDQPAVPPASTDCHTFRGKNREVVAKGPENTTIVVGRPADGLASEMRRFAWQLIVTGAGVLAIGLLGGWIISKQILRPVATISATATRITATNLSERIDTAQLDRELVGLGVVLNDTFDRLQAAFDRQARFTADASHELRTPLAVIRSQAELVLSRERSPEEYQLAVHTSLRAALRMTALVERLLMLARTETGLAGMKMEEVDWQRTIRSVAEELAPAAEKKGVRIKLDLLPVRVLGDAGALAQLAANLLGNAIKYNRPGGQIWVSLSNGADGALFAISDSGIGIPLEDHPRIFERFYRADKARSRRKGGGSGLGLAICKAIVEAHGGEIHFDSAPGEGTTFRVTLPKERPLSQTALAPVQAPAPAPVAEPIPVSAGDDAVEW